MILDALKEGIGWKRIAEMGVGVGTLYRARMTLRAAFHLSAKAL